MDKGKHKISVEIPAYLKEWINKHDLSQNALVTLGLRLVYKQEQQASENIIVDKIIGYLENKKLPF